MNLTHSRTLLMICVIILISINLFVQCTSTSKPTDDEVPLSFDHHRVDHESFLAPDEAKQFENLSIDESKKKLAQIADKIDKDKNGYVTLKELEQWIKIVQKNFIERDTQKNWKIYNPQNLDKLSWEEYRSVTYSFLDNTENGIGDDDLKKYRSMEQKDRRRWKLADTDKDNHLTYEEFVNFLHPERNDKMMSVVVDETLEDIDSDGDGKISLEEYVQDMYRDDPKHEPDWVDYERKQFVEVRDKNKDGYLDRDEVKDWLSPPNSHSEAEHLIEISDTNKDGKLSKEEILDQFDHFVGSEVTDYGQMVTHHDEF